MNATDILGQLLGAGNQGGGNLNTGAGAKMLEDLLGVGTANSSGSGQQGGGVFGGDGQTSGGTTSGGSAGGSFGQRNTGSSTTGQGGLGELLGKALKELGRGQAGANTPFEQTPQSPQIPQNAQAEVYLRAMIQAGLADGRLDETEQQTIIQKVGNVGAAEQNFIREEIAKGLNIESFIQTVPRGIEEEVYTASLMSITLDNRAGFTHNQRSV